jgi:hypothetical protein
VNATKYTITPAGEVFEVRESIAQFRKDARRGWVEDPHVEGYRLHGAPCIRSPFGGDRSEEVLYVLREGLEARGQLVNYSEVVK